MFNYFQTPKLGKILQVSNCDIYFYGCEMLFIVSIFNLNFSLRFKVPFKIDQNKTIFFPYFCRS